MKIWHYGLGIVLVIVVIVMVVMRTHNTTVTQLNDREFELSPFKYRLTHNSLLDIDGIKMTSIKPGKWVDRVEISDFLEGEGCHIWHCDYEKLIFEVDGDRIEFIKQIAPKLRELSKNLQKGKYKLIDISD